MSRYSGSDTVVFRTASVPKCGDAQIHILCHIEPIVIRLVPGNAITRTTRRRLFPTLMRFTKPAWVAHKETSDKKKLGIFSISVHPDGSRVATGGLGVELAPKDLAIHKLYL